MEVTLPFSLSPELTNLTRRSCLHVVPGCCRWTSTCSTPGRYWCGWATALRWRASGAPGQKPGLPGGGPRAPGHPPADGELRTFQTVYAQEKSFTYQDTLVLPAGRPDAAELLRTGPSAPAPRRGSSATSWSLRGGHLQLLCRGTTAVSSPGTSTCLTPRLWTPGRRAKRGCATWTCSSLM